MAADSQIDFRIHAGQCWSFIADFIWIQLGGQLTSGTQQKVEDDGVVPVG